MNVLDMSFKRTSYEVEVTTSVWFECALGIAMITYPKLHGSLDKPEDYYANLRSRASRKLEAELEYCQTHNTWKMLLQLLHATDEATLEGFMEHVHGLTGEELRFMILPFLEASQEMNRRQASAGDAAAADAMQLACQGHPFFPQMIHHIMSTDPNRLKEHLLQLIKLWYEEFVCQEQTELSAVLQRDKQEKSGWVRALSPEEAVLRATGVEFSPEPDIAKVLLVPHVIYRPWTIEATLGQTKIFYYPVSDTSLSGQDDPAQPPAKLVQLYKALGDEKRLRALKLIAEQDRSLKDLTDLLGIGKTTVHHHLAVLRAAHLVRVKGGHYSWNPHALNGHEQELKGYLSFQDAE